MKKTKKPKLTAMDKKVEALRKREAKRAKALDAQRAQWNREREDRDREYERELQREDEAREAREELRASLVVLEGGNYFTSRPSKAKLTVFINEEYAS